MKKIQVWTDTGDEDKVVVMQCVHCKKFNLWADGKYVWPEFPKIKPSEYLPPDARHAFDEAQKVIGRSPQCACAMLRLSLERLVVSLGATGQNLQAKILSLNLHPSVEKMCEACRAVGNDSVHESLLFMLRDDNFERAIRLSKFINWITERTYEADAAAEEILRDAANVKQKKLCHKD